MMGRFGREDLDAWARSLGARTDDEAVAALRRIDRLLMEASERLVKANALTDRAAGVSTGLQDDVSDACRATVQARDLLFTVVAAFGRHERGGR